MLKVTKLEILGAFLAVIFGSFLHFAYAISSYFKPVALVAAVNESTWEHLKLGFWPLLFWAVYEYFIFGKKYKNFVIAKAVTLLSFVFLVPTIFYSYSTVLGRNYLIFDISTFAVSVILAQWLGYVLIRNKKDIGLKTFGIFILGIMLIAFLTFSFFPPHNFLFLDPVSGNYGIIK